MSRFKIALQNISLFLITIFVFVLFLEFVVFRFVASDIPTNTFKNGIVKYAPNQEGVYRIKNEISAHYKINDQGYNSPIQNFNKQKEKERILIIGDSYVEALMVDYNNSLAEQLDRSLQNRFEVLRMGVSGAPLSQYLYMLRNDGISYEPDIVVVVLVHNDFDESFRFMAGRYTSAFMKLDLTQEKTEEIEPAFYTTTYKDFLRQTATARFLYYRMQLANITNIFAKQSSFTDNIDTETINAHKKDIEKATDYLFEQFKILSDQHNFKLLFIMDGSRANIYRNASEDRSFLNQIAQKYAQKHNIDFEDLHDRFLSNYLVENEHFEYQNDWHWNAKGHKIAAEAIREWVLVQNLLMETYDRK